MSDPDRLTSRDDTASLTSRVLSFGLLWLLSLRSSGIRSWLPRCRDAHRDPISLAEHRAKIVCGHLGDNRTVPRVCAIAATASRSLQTPVRVAIAKALVEGLIARRHFEPFAFVWTVEIDRAIQEGVW